MWIFVGLKLFWKEISGISRGITGSKSPPQAENAALFKFQIHLEVTISDGFRPPNPQNFPGPGPIRIYSGLKLFWKEISGISRGITVSKSPSQAENVALFKFQILM